jgi:hypothetical protein
MLIIIVVMMAQLVCVGVCVCCGKACHLLYIKFRVCSVHQNNVKSFSSGYPIKLQEANSVNESSVLAVCLTCAALLLLLLLSWMKWKQNVKSMIMMMIKINVDIYWARTRSTKSMYSCILISALVNPRTFPHDMHEMNVEGAGWWGENRIALKYILW